MLPDEQIAVLVRRYQFRLDDLASRSARAAMAAWDELVGYDEADVATFVRRVSPVVVGAKTAAVATGVGFYATLLTIRPPTVRAASIPTVFNPRSGFLAAWHALAQGRPYEEAVAAGRAMTEAATSNTVISAARRTGDAVATGSRAGVVGWRRVLDGKACDWCQVISTQRYRTAESADFGHDRCGCTPVPIVGDRDPGRIVNRDLLAELKARGAVDKASASRTASRTRN